MDQRAIPKDLEGSGRIWDSNGDPPSSPLRQRSTPGLLKDVGPGSWSKQNLEILGAHVSECIDLIALSGSCSEGGVATDFTLVVWMFCWFMLVLSPSKHISIKLTFSHSSMSRHFLVFGAKNTRTRAQQLNWIGSYPFYPGWNEAWGFFFGATKPKSPVFRCSTGEYQRSVCPMPVPTCSNMFWPDSLHESRWRSRTSWHSHVKSSERQLSSWCESESDQELQLVYIGLLMHLDDMRGCNTRATFRPNSVLQALLARCPISRVSSLTKQERTVTIRDLMTTCSISGCRALQLEPGNPVTGAFTSSTRASRGRKFQNWNAYSHL